MSDTRKVIDLVQAVLGEDCTVEKSTMRSDEVAWDSLKHAELIITLEEEFEVTFSIEEIETLDGVASILGLLRAHGYEV